MQFFFPELIRSTEPMLKSGHTFTTSAKTHYDKVAL